MTETVPFPVDPPGIDDKGRGTVIFVPTIADLDAPTVAEIEAGVNLSCVLYAFNVAPTQNRVERVKYCYKVIAEQFGQARYAIDPVEYDYDPQDPDSDDYGHYGELYAGRRGFLIDRRGLDVTESVEAGQYVDVIPVELGIQGRMAVDPREEGGKLRIRQEIAVVGEPVLDATVAA